MCSEFSKRAKPGSVLQTVTGSFPYVLECRVWSDAGWLWFEVTGFRFRNSRPPLGRALRLTRAKLVCKTEKEPSQLSVRGPASWSPALRWIMGKEVRGGTWGLRHEVTRWGELPSFLRETVPGVTLQKTLLPRGVLFRPRGPGFPRVLLARPRD